MECVKYIKYHLEHIICLGDDMKGRKNKIMKNLSIISQYKKSIPNRDIDSAINIAKKLIESLEIKKYPVPIVSILNDLGFSVFVTDIKDKNISGFIAISPDYKDKFNTDKIIAVESTDTIGRQRFTMAHEFAHYLFDFNETNNATFFNTYDIEKSNTDEEAIPSRFAAEFLMPDFLFKKRFNELENLTYYEKINQLVDDFNVTTKAVKKRIEELNLQKVSDGQ